MNHNEREVPGAPERIWIKQSHTTESGLIYGQYYVGERQWASDIEYVPAASSTQDGLTVESLRSELRQLFPDVQIIVDIRDCGTETQTLRGSTLEYGAQIGMNGNEFVGDSPAQVLAAVRAWKLKEGK